MRISLYAAFFASLYTISVTADQPRPSRSLDIVDRSIAFHGGERFVASVTTLDICSKSGCFHVMATVDGGRFTLEASRESERGLRRVRVDNETVTVWLGDAREPVAPANEQRRRDWVMQRVYFAFLPYRLNDPSVWKQDFGLETWNGHDLHKVKVTFTPGSSTDADDEFMYWFDPSTARLVQLAYSYKGSPGGLRFRRMINERRVGGILFFDQENYGAEGDHLRVDDVTPAFAASMPLVSTVRLENIAVSDLE